MKVYVLRPGKLGQLATLPRILMRRLSCPLPLLAAAIALAAMMTGCATKPAADDPDAMTEYNQTNDPLEPTNRVFYVVNDGLDTVILRPLALAYK